MLYVLGSGGRDHSGESELSQPEDVAVSPDGNTVAVADTGRKRGGRSSCPTNIGITGGTPPSVATLSGVAIPNQYWNH